MPFDIGVLRRSVKLDDLVDGFLHVVLTEGALPGAIQRPNFFGSLQFADGQQANLVRVPIRLLCGSANACLHLCQALASLGQSIASLR